MTAALGTHEAELRELPAEPELPVPTGRARSVAWLAFAVAIGALLGGLAIYALTGRSNNVASSPSSPTPTAMAPTTAPRSTPTPLPTLPRSGMIDIGQVFTANYYPIVTSTSPRAAFTAATFGGPLLVRPARENVSLSRQGFGVDAIFAGVTFHVRLTPVEGTAFIPGSDDSLAIYPTKQAIAPQLLVFVTDQDNATHAADVTPDGRVVIDPNPIAPSAVVALPTGEQLDVSRATRLGTLTGTRSGYSGTNCDTVSNAAPTTCIASIETTTPLLSPTSGTVSCRSGVVELEGPQATLVFRIQRAPGLQETAPCVGPTGRAVLVGDVIEADVLGDVSITAADPAGNPVPVVMAGDGTLYVGDIHPTVGCPCGGLN